MINKIKAFFSKSIQKIKKKLDDEKLNDFLDVLKFILVHGFVMMFVLVLIITLLGLNFLLVDVIRQSIQWSLFFFIWGGGSFYYILLDFNKYLKDVWGKKQR